MTDNYQELIQKLDAFIRKFYINKVIKGALWTLGFTMLFLLLMIFLEDSFYFKSSTRTMLVYSWVASSVVAFIAWVGLPLMRYFNLGKVINHEQAATIIGDHFENVKDKLLNTLQLKKQASTDQSDLLLASIEQKSASIKLVPFRSAIDLSKNKKHLKYALPPLLVLLALIIGAPSMIKNTTNRLVRSSEEFEKPAPFYFNISNPELSVVQYEDLPIEVEVTGEKLPSEAFIDIEGYQYRMTQKNANTFTYTFKNVQKPKSFKFASGAVASKKYDFDVIYKPSILDMEVSLDYPSYTGKSDESLKNIGDLVVPVGTNIRWYFKTQHTDLVRIGFGDAAKEEVARKGRDDHSFAKKAMKDNAYKVYFSNELIANPDSILYRLNVVPDLSPSIAVKSFPDSIANQAIYFVGEASDDYGLVSLSFNYQVRNASGQLGPVVSEKLTKPAARQVDFQYELLTEKYKLQAGEELVYYFEVFDNDQVNGNKSARTSTFIFSKPSLEELEEQTKENNEEIKSDLEEAIKESAKLQEEIKKLREKLLQKKELDWQTKKELEMLLEQQKMLEERIKNAKENYQENLKNQQELNKDNPELQEKQEKLEKMLDEIFDPEKQSLMEKIQELMQKMDKDEALEMMEEMESSDEEMEMDLDRLQELFKKMEMEAQLDEAIKKMEELAEKQEELAEENRKEEKSAEEVQKEQEEIKKELEKLQEEMNEVEEKNKKLEKPKDLDNPQEEMEDIKEEMEKSQEQMEQKNRKDAAKKQKKAADKMKQMAQKMQEQMQGGEMEQLDLDMKALRQLLENLVSLSFDQEALMEQFNETPINTPKYVESVQEQYKIKEDFKIVEDSLHALSKRVYQIESVVTEKVANIKKDMKESIKLLEGRKKSPGAREQQSTMKSLNDLALMLSDVMSQMQDQMSQMMSGSQMCDKPKPGGKKGNLPMDKITEKQKQLSEKLKKMIEERKKGGKQEGGQGGKDGEKGSSKEFAKTAAEQGALRRALEKLKEEKQEQGQNGQQLQKMIDQMDKVEEDLVNKRLNNEMLNRQQDILKFLIDYEKAEQEKEKDKKRKAEVATEKERKLPPELEEYLKKRNAEVEQLEYISPDLKPFYKKLVEEYQRQLKN